MLQSVELQYKREGKGGREEGREIGRKGGERGRERRRVVWSEKGDWKKGY